MRLVSPANNKSPFWAAGVGSPICSSVGSPFSSVTPERLYGVSPEGGGGVRGVSPKEGQTGIKAAVGMEGAGGTGGEGVYLPAAAKGKQVRLAEEEREGKPRIRRRAGGGGMDEGGVEKENDVEVWR